MPLYNRVVHDENGGLRREDKQYHDQEFMEVGRDIMDSEELVNGLYEFLIGVAPDEWVAAENLAQGGLSRDDLGLTYMLGPYIPCTKRTVFTNQIDTNTDGFPNITVTGTLKKTPIISIVRPILKFPRDIHPIARCHKRYKMVSMWPSEEHPHQNRMDILPVYFGISPKGMIISTHNTRVHTPAMYHAAATLYPAVHSNLYADAKHLWLAEVVEDLGVLRNYPFHVRLGLNKEHIKSLFYARKMPVTETGRKRPILHWVRAHERRIREGVDVDVKAHLRGITEVEMDSLKFSIYQPNKEELRKADPETLAEALRLYGPKR